MKTRLRILRDCRGEMSYISTVIGVFVLLLFVVLAVNVFSVLTMRQNMQQVIDLTLDRLAADGSAENAALYFSDACGKAGIAAEDASFTLEGTAFLDEENLLEQYSALCVQYGEPICLQMTCRVSFMGGSVLFPSMTLQVQGSTLSEVVFK